MPIVTVALPIPREVVDHEEFTGRTDAVSRVDIRARVSGYLIHVNFKDGDVVKLNDVLYQIDPRPFQDDLDLAKGALESLRRKRNCWIFKWIAIANWRQSRPPANRTSISIWPSRRRTSCAEVGPGAGRELPTKSRFHPDRRAADRKDQPHAAYDRQPGQRR